MKSIVNQNWGTPDLMESNSKLQKGEGDLTETTTYLKDNMKEQKGDIIGEYNAK